MIGYPVAIVIVRYMVFRLVIGLAVAIVIVDSKEIQVLIAVAQCFMLCGALFQLCLG